MTVLTRTPDNTNPLQPTKFLLTFDKIRDTQYFCQTVNIPGISLGEVVRTTPFLDMYSPGTKLNYEPLQMDFIVDSELTSWKNMYNWFISMADPDGFEKRDPNYSASSTKHMSDAVLTVLSSLNNPLVRIQYRNLFPTSLGEIKFDTTQSAETIITCTASFRYESYNYLTL